MFDLNGNVIGINSALISPTGASVGIGLAIPAEAAKPVIDSLMRGQRPSRGYLGVGLQAVDEDLAPALGIAKDTGELVRSVVPDGPAARAGLQQGDVIVRVNGQQVTPDQTVSYLVANTPVGARIPLEIIRAGKRATVTVVVAQRPTEEALGKLSGGSDNSSGPDASPWPRKRRWACRWHRSLRSLLAPPACPRARAASSSLRSIRTAMPRTRGSSAPTSSSPSTTSRSQLRRRSSRQSTRRATRDGQACCCWSSAATTPRSSSASTSAANRPPASSLITAEVRPLSRLAGWRPYPARIRRTRTASVPSESAW